MNTNWPALDKKPWELPAPPEGREWHRTDWTQEMLPEGWRPLFYFEQIEPGDQCLVNGNWLTHDGIQDTLGKAIQTTNHHRTRRPLPASPAPAEEKSDTPITDAMRAFVERIELLTRERDEAGEVLDNWATKAGDYRRRAESAEARITKLESPWKPIAQLPTKEDADPVRQEVLWRAWDGRPVADRWDIGDQVLHRWGYTHWMSIPSLNVNKSTGTEV